MKICVVYHSVDLDGWMSAAIVKKYYRDININNTDTNSQYNFKDNGSYETIPILNSHNEVNFIGYNYGDTIPDLSEYDKVIMCDISFPKNDMVIIAEKFGLNFIWNDHHISAINSFNTSDVDGYYPEGNRNANFAACELTWKYFYPNITMPEIVRLLGRYDCFGHKGTDEETKVLEFQYGARQSINSYETAYERLSKSILDTHKGIAHLVENSIHSEGKAIYKYLCTEAKWIYKMGKTIVLKESKYDKYGNETESVYRSFLAINCSRFNPVNFGIDYHADGYDGIMCYNYNKDKWTASLYNDNGEVDCSIIAKSFGGGGHKGAAGFVGDTNKFMKILNWK